MKELMTAPDASELYNIKVKPEGKSLDISDDKPEKQDETKEFIDRETVHTCNDTQQDYAHNKEIMKQLPKDMPAQVRKHVERQLTKDAFIDSNASADQKKNILKHHRKKTKEMLNDRKKAEMSSDDKKESDDKKIIDKVIEKGSVQYSDAVASMNLSL